MYLLTKYGLLDGLKYVIDELKLPYYSSNYGTLLPATYYLHDNVLRYLLIENNFYKPFDIKIMKIKYNETLWESSLNGLKDIIEPGKGWLHV